MKCKQCNSEFIAKRSDALFCSAKCRVTFNRVTDNSVTDNSVTDNLPEIDVNSNPLPNKVKYLDRSSYLDYLPKCSIDTCNLRSPPGHLGFCIYHWRKNQETETMSQEKYNLINIGRP